MPLLIQPCTFLLVTFHISINMLEMTEESLYIFLPGLWGRKICYRCGIESDPQQEVPRPL